MDSDKSEIESEIRKLLASREDIETQREILGDTVNPIVDQINSKISEFTPPEPTEEQKQILASWQTVRETTESLGLEVPSPSREILEAQQSVERYETITQLLGGLSTTESVEVEEQTIEPTTITEPSKPTPDEAQDKPESVIIDEARVVDSEEKNEVLHKNNTDKPTELSDELIAYLLGSDTLNLSPEISLQLTPDNFRLLIVKAVNEYEEDVADKLIFRFASLATVEFSDAGDIDLSPIANMIDRDAGNFIQSMSSVGNFAVLSLDDLLDLKKIYNNNNMLAFAKDLIERNVDTKSLDYLVMVYRYRTVLKQLDDACDKAAVSSLGQTPTTLKVSSVVDHYGHEYDRINLSSYSDFAEKEDDNADRPIIIAGEPVKRVESIWN